MEDQQSQSEYSKIIVKAWLDPQFKEKLLKNPIQALKEQGIEIAKGMNIVACENTDKTFYLVLPCKPKGTWTEQELESIAAGKGDRPPRPPRTPRPPGQEYRSSE